MFKRAKSDSPAERQPTSVEQAALGWVVRSERGLTSEQETEFRQWLEASAEHRALFEEFGGTWSLLGQAQELPQREPEVGSSSSWDSGDDSRRRSRLHGGGVWRPMAAAAGIAIAIVGPRRCQPGALRIATEVGAMRDLQLPDGSIVK